jgi:predicted ATPase
MTVLINKAIICPILIGRTRELTALYSLIDADRSEQDQVVLISGEAGIGKSRLVAEAKSYAVAQGFLYPNHKHLTLNSKNVASLLF